MKTKINILRFALLFLIAFIFIKCTDSEGLNNTYPDPNTPTTFEKPYYWKSVSAGSNFTIALRSDNTLWAWGDNSYGQLGDGTTISKNIPIQIGEENEWQIISAGWNHTLALKTDGSLWQWGGIFKKVNSNSSITVTTKNPIQIGTAKNWKFINASNAKNLAITTDNILWTWGFGNSGQIGNNTIFVDENDPIQIGNSTAWSTADIGSLYTIGIKKDGSMWAWGINYYGGFGDGTEENKFVPTKIGFDTNWKMIETGIHSVAIKTDGTLWAWGYNEDGELGDGTYISKNIPTQIGTDTDWKTIKTTHQHTLGLKTDGSLWAWGINYQGQLGDGTNAAKNIPIRIGIENNWVEICTSAFASFALKTDKTLWGWGSNEYGQLGNGTFTNANSPILIPCPQ